MRRIRRGGRRRIGRRAHAGFVGEQAALHAPGHRTGDTVTDGAGRGFLQAEGAFEDQRRDRRHVLDVMANHPEGQQQVGARHQRHHQFGHFGNGANAAEDYHPAQHHRADADVQRLQMEGDGGGWAMELACTALNTEPNAMIRKMENSTPIQRMPRPFSM